MTLSCRERLVDAVETALKGIGGIDGLRVARPDDTEITDEDLPLLLLIEGAELAQADFSGEDGFTLGVVVEGYVTAATAEEVRRALARLRGLVERAVMGSGLLGGLARDIRVSDDQPAELSMPIPGPQGGGFGRAYDIDYATAEGDPFAFAAGQ